MLLVIGASEKILFIEHGAKDVFELRAALQLVLANEGMFRKPEQDKFHGYQLIRFC